MSQSGENFLIIRGKENGPGNVSFDENDPDSIMAFPFNPTEYSIDEGNTFSEAAMVGSSSPALQFSRGNARILKVELLLDTYTYKQGKDLLKEYIHPLDLLSKIDSDLHAPPPCLISWGTLTFVGVIESVAKRYLLFKEDGTPVRARVSLQIKEYVAVGAQRKETPFFSPDKRKVWTIQEKDSLWALAAKAYGDPRQWRILAEANKIEDPLTLSPGRTLVVPPLR